MQLKVFKAGAGVLLFCYTGFIMLLLMAEPALAKNISALKTGKLTCEYISNPLGISEPAPRLSWTLLSDKRNQQQSAYEVQVSDQLTALRSVPQDNYGGKWQPGLCRYLKG